MSQQAAATAATAAAATAAAAERSRQRRTSNFTSREVDALVATVKANFDVLYGRFSKRLSNKEARRRAWHRVLDEVNLVSHDGRTLSQVKNKWKKCKEAAYGKRRGTAACCDSASDDYDEIDSMPLQQRIETQTDQRQQEPVLQSQPLSPTKLKVTRQAAKPPSPEPPPLQVLPPNDEVCLKWNSHYQNLQSAFPALLSSERYSDATLVSEGRSLKCHRVILSSCSTYFEDVLKDISPFQHPVLFMRDTPFWVLRALCDFMYAGEVHIFQNKLEELLKVADALQIKGLAGKPEEKDTVVPNPEPTIKEEKLKLKEEDREPIKEEKKREERPERPKRHQIKEEALKIPPKPSKSSTIPSKSQPVPSRSHYIPTRSQNSQSKPNLNSKNQLVAKTPQPQIVTRRLERRREKKSSDDITDPLDLLEPMYEEEIKKDPPPQPPKLKDSRSVAVAKQPVNKTVKKGMPRRIRKRKYIEDREESPPPMFTSRKGTRSRPNVKVPKYFHSSFDNSEINKSAESDEATIVWEPHTRGNINLPIQFEEIKAEPIDIEDVPVELEDNLENFGEEEIIGNYDSPIVNLKEKGDKSLVPQPVIMNVCTVEEENREENTLKIVDISQIGARKEILESEIVPHHSKNEREDPLNLPEKIVEKVPKENAVLETEKETEIIISNVETITENQIVEKIMETQKELIDGAVLESGNLLGFHIESIVGKFGEENQEGDKTKGRPSEECSKPEQQVNEENDVNENKETEEKAVENEEKLCQGESVETEEKIMEGNIEERKEEPSIENSSRNEEATVEETVQTQAESQETTKIDDRLMLDDDLSFETSLLEASSSTKADGDQSEKTLEMIVNDLNESLERDLKKEENSDDHPS